MSELLAGKVSGWLRRRLSLVIKHFNADLIARKLGMLCLPVGSHEHLALDHVFDWFDALAMKLTRFVRAEKSTGG